MRYFELFETSPVSSAQAKKAAAAQSYQKRLRAIRDGVPAPDVGAKQSDARDQYQRRIRDADEAIRRSMANQKSS